VINEVRKPQSKYNFPLFCYCNNKVLVGYGDSHCDWSSSSCF